MHTRRGHQSGFILYPPIDHPLIHSIITRLVGGGEEDQHDQEKDRAQHEAGNGHVHEERRHLETFMLSDVHHKKIGTIANITDKRQKQEATNEKHDMKQKQNGSFFFFSPPLPSINIRERSKEDCTKCDRGQGHDTMLTRRQKQFHGAGMTSSTSRSK